MASYHLAPREHCYLLHRRCICCTGASNLLSELLKRSQVLLERASELLKRLKNTAICCTGVAFAAQALYLLHRHYISTEQALHLLH